MAFTEKSIPEDLFSYELALTIGEKKETYELWFRDGYRKSGSGSMDGYTYCFNGRTYRDVESLCKESVEDLSKTVQIVTDIYTEKVLKVYTQIPTFDSSDREWDSKRVELLMFDGREVHLVLMRGGYRIASLTFYENLQAADRRMLPLFEKLGWPVSQIHWV